MSTAYRFFQVFAAPKPLLYTLENAFRIERWHHVHILLRPRIYDLPTSNVQQRSLLSGTPGLCETVHISTERGLLDQQSGRTIDKGIWPYTVFPEPPGMLRGLLTPLQSQIEDLQYLSQQYEQQEAARMVRASGAMHSADFYVNKPIPVQQRHREGAAQLR